MIYDVRFDAVLNQSTPIHSIEFAVEAASPEEAASLCKLKMEEYFDIWDYGWYFTEDCDFGDENEAVDICSLDKIEVDSKVIVTQTLTFLVTL